MGFPGLCRASGARSRDARNAGAKQADGNAAPALRTKPPHAQNPEKTSSSRERQNPAGTPQTRIPQLFDTRTPRDKPFRITRGSAMRLRHSRSAEPRRGGTTPRTPGASPGTNLAPNPSLGEAAQSAGGFPPARDACAAPPTPAPAACAKKNVPAGFPRENVFFQEAFALRLICGGGARRRARARPSPRADRTPTVPESRRH